MIRFHITDKVQIKSYIKLSMTENTLIFYVVVYCLYLSYRNEGVTIRIPVKCQ